MIANYGYKDGSGDFFIAIDTDKCIECEDHPCVEACPKNLFNIIVDDYDDEVAEILKEERSKLKYTCAECKGTDVAKADFPCMKACTPGAIDHSW